MTTLRQKVLPLYVAIFATLLPALIQTAQAIPLNTKAGGNGYLVICTARGLVYERQSQDNSQPAPKNSSDTCPVCISVSIAQNTIASAHLSGFTPRFMAGIPFGQITAAPRSLAVNLRHRPRAPPW